MRAVGPPPVGGDGGPGPGRVERLTVDVPVVVGSGVAGLTAALGLGRAVVLTPGPLGSTGWAQGGIAAAVGADDSPRLHADDTLSVSAGLGVRAAVELLTAGGPAAIDRLVGLGARFDRDGAGRIALGREAGHRRRRIVHADGDATGAEVQRTLWTAVQDAADVDVRDGWRLLDLLRDAGGVTGVLVADREGRRVALSAPAVVLATGGIGQLYRHTTNPVGVCGDGLAAAARAGARLSDLEMVQFHPTALAVGRDPMPLLTEALRGEGAVLVDGRGRRFMVDRHPAAELAPRDVVARAIWAERRDGGGAFLDARAVADVARRFPTVTAHCRAAGLDPQADLLPVSPAAHFHMGGVDAGPSGRTSVPGLWAVGEVAATGVHGANRLASNSLLEGSVFGALAAQDVAGSAPPLRRGGSFTAGFDDLPLDAVPEIDTVRQLMWDHAGVVRSARGLARASEELAELEESLSKSVPGRVALEVAGLVTTAALRRPESRGGHHRSDHPEQDPTLGKRSLVEPTPAGVA